MLNTSMLHRPLFWLLAACSLVCVVTALRIEYLNVLAGGAIQQKAAQEPNSKWRTGGGFHAALQQVEQDFRREKGIAPETELSPMEYAVIRQKMQMIQWEPDATDQLGELLGTWGLMQYPLSIFLIFASLTATGGKRGQERIPQAVFVAFAMVGVLALGMAFYRGYFTSLGW